MQYLVLFFCFVLFAPEAFSQWRGGSGLRFDFSYHYHHYSEPGVMDERGQLTGFTIEPYLSLGEGFGLSAEGQYFLGHPQYDGATFSGTPVKTTVRDWISKYNIGPYIETPDFVFRVAYAQRTWMDDLVISYRRETRYKFVPITLGFKSAPIYFNVTYNHFLEGENFSGMSKMAANRHDVTVKQNKGYGYGFELGWLMESSPFKTKMAAFYEKWLVDESEVGNDGTQNLIEPQNNTESFGISIGLIY